MCRRVRFGKGNYVTKWPRRAGKTYTLLNLIKPMFGKQKVHDKVQKDTEILLMDDWSKDKYDKVLKKHKDIRIIGFYFK